MGLEKMAEIGMRLRALRESKGFSQQTVANALSIHQSAYSNIEAGNRNLSAWEMLQLSTLFGFSLDKFRKEIEK